MNKKLRWRLGFVLVLAGWLPFEHAVHASQWARTYGGADDDEAVSAQQTTDGGYIMSGLTGSFGPDGVGDAWLVRLDPNGNIVWQRNYGGAQQDYFNSVRATADGGYVIAGYTVSFGAGFGDASVLKVDAKGEIQRCAIIGSGRGIASVGTLATGAGAAAGSASAAVPVATPATPQDSAGVSQQQCFFHDPRVSVPTLSDWLLIAMTGVLGLLGAAMLHRNPSHGARRS